MSGHGSRTAGEDVTFIARGANLDALKSRGIRLLMGDGSEQAVPHVKATADYAAAGPHDLVILAMKAHQVEAVAPDVPKLFGPDTAVRADAERHPVLVLSRGMAARLAGTQVRSVDPNGADRREHSLRAGHRLRRVSGNRAALPRGHQARRGQPLSRSASPMARPASGSSGCPSASSAAGLQAPVLADIRAEIWLKLWGNLTFNPISALSRATLAGICQYPLSRDSRAGR